MVGKIRRLVLITSEGHPQQRYFDEVVKELSEVVNAEVEVRKDDYVYLSKYGETDELGLTWLPQLFAELESGEVIKVLTQPALTPEGKLDVEGGVKQALRNLGIKT